jgi:hypothetical protein
VGDTTSLNPMSGGELVDVEGMSDGSIMPVTKVHVGEEGSTIGPVSSALPLPTRDEALIAEVRALRAEIRAFYELALERFG